MDGILYKLYKWEFSLNISICFYIETKHHLKETREELKGNNDDQIFVC